MEMIEVDISSKCIALSIREYTIARFHELKRRKRSKDLFYDKEHFTNSYLSPPCNSPNVDESISQRIFPTRNHNIEK